MTQAEENYMRGFIDKCAELGVDPEELVKQAGVGSVLMKALGGVGRFGRGLGTGLRHPLYTGLLQVEGPTVPKDLLNLFRDALARKARQAGFSAAEIASRMPPAATLKEMAIRAAGEYLPPGLPAAASGAAERWGRLLGLPLIATALTGGAAVAGVGLAKRRQEKNRGAVERIIRSLAKKI